MSHSAINLRRKLLGWGHLRVCVCASWINLSGLLQACDPNLGSSCLGKRTRGDGQQQLWRNTTANGAKKLLFRRFRKKEENNKSKHNNHCLLPLFSNLSRMCLSCLTLFILISILLLCGSCPLGSVKIHRKLLPQWDFSHIFCSLGI